MHKLLENETEWRLSQAELKSIQLTEPTKTYVSTQGWKNTKSALMMAYAARPSVKSKTVELKHDTL